jgi:site-specific DNA recombinase
MGTPRQAEEVMRVALYARVSSEGQADRGTIEAQIDFLRRYAQLHGLDIAGEYLDEAVHGPVPLGERPAGRRLVTDAKAHKFEKVIVYRTDRFARSLYELLDAQRVLDSLGIGLQSASEPYDTSTPVGRLIFQILGSIAELERSTIVERGTSGKARVARNGQWPGGPAPLGYCVHDRRLVPNERVVEALGMSEADVVRDLFQRIAQGSTLVKEAQRLEAAGLKGRNGGTLNPQNLGKLLHMTIYKGEHTFRGKGGTIVREVAALVTPELWAVALAQLESNSTRPETAWFSLLRGKIRCSGCGGSYVMSSTRSRNQVYYRCITTLKSGGRRCRSVNLNGGALERYVWSECLDLLRHPGKIEASAQSEIRGMEEAGADRASEVLRLERGLAEQEAAKQRIIGLVRRGKISDVDADRDLDEINTEIGRVHARLSALDASRSLTGEYTRRLRAAEALVIRIAKGVDRGIANLEDDGHRRRIVDALLHSIEVKTIGDGRDRRVDLWFKWLGQERTGLVDPQEFGNMPLGQDGFALEECPSGIKVVRLAAALAEQTTHVTSGGASKIPTTPACCTSSS